MGAIRSQNTTHAKSLNAIYDLDNSDVVRARLYTSCETIIIGTPCVELGDCSLSVSVLLIAICTPIGANIIGPEVVS